MITPPLSPNIIVPEDMEIIEKVLDHEEGERDDQRIPGSNPHVDQVIFTTDDPKAIKSLDEEVESLKKPEEV